MVIGQFHADDDTTSPPLAIEMVGEKMAVVVRYQLPGETSQKMFYAYVDDSDIQRGKYYDIKITARFSNDDNGFVDVWRDGKQLVDYNGPLGYGYDVYWKHGIYREESKETLAVNYKNFSLTTDGGVVIVGTKSSDIVASNESPSGQPTPTDQGDLIVLKKGKDVVVAGAGDDKVVAGGGKDKIDGGDGNDILKGGKGKDIFTFAQDFGNDKIKDYKPNKDKIEFSGIFDDYKDMKDHWYKHKGSTVIDVDGDSVLISKVKPGKLDAHDFLFT